jgi:RNA polymerase sigma factor (sigma-70 family)
MHPDHQYIEALRNNDPGGIQAIYANYSDQVKRWIVQHNGTVADARDVFQEAMIALFDKSRDPDFVLTCPLGALVHIICSRKWIDRLRTQNRESEVRKLEEARYTTDETPTDALVAMEETLAAEAGQQKLAAAFARLSDLCRELLSMLTGEVSPRETAEKLNMNSVDTLYRRKNACIQRWRALYAES